LAEVMVEFRNRSRGFAQTVVLGVLSGIFLGVGVFTFGYARGGSYMTDNPEACANCHVMRDQYASWMKGSHRKAAVCNDCHTPPGFLAKYATKAINGFHHSLAFTTGRFPDQIQITERNFKIAQESCLKCHADITQGIRGIRQHNSQINCIQCHQQVGHQ
jgi:cytochrome c nitrite reductase small subunit